MSNDIVKAVWNYAVKNLTGIQKSILVRMAFYDAYEGGSVYPSIALLSKQTNFSITTIK